MASDTASSPAPPALRLSGPVDLLVAVPYLLGFTPQRSLVVVALDPAGKVALVARLSLPAAEAGRPADARASAGALRRTGADHMSRGAVAPSVTAAREMAVRVGVIAARAGADSALAVLYPAPAEQPTAPGAPWRTFADVLRDALTPIELLDCLAVVDRQWWSLLCAGATCCPAEGRTLPAAGTTRVEAGAVLAGLVALADRDDVAAALAPAPPDRRDPVAALLECSAGTAGGPDRADKADRAGDSGSAGSAGGAGGPGSSGGRGEADIPGLDWTPQKLTEALGLVDAMVERRLSEPRTPIPAAEAAALLRAVSDARIRDAVSRCESTARGDAAVSVWTELVRLAPPRWLPGPASLLAASAYQCGNGVLAAAAADTVLAQDPGHVLAGQLARALEVGMSPSELAPIFEAGARAARASIVAMA